MKFKLNQINPRTINKDKFKKLVQSIKDFPKMLELRPIVVDKDGVILGGNMRFRALQELKMDIKPTWIKVADKLTDEERRRFIVEDNLEFGLWNFDELSTQYDVDELLEWGFSEKDLKIETEIEEDEAPEVSSEPAISKLGEVYQLGRHRLMCGDATKIEDVEKLMDGKKADMVFTDPPYLMGFTGNVHADGSKSHNAKHGAILNDKMSKADGDQFIYDIIEIINTFCTGAYYVCFYRLGLDYIFKAMEKLSMNYKALIIWSKGNHTLSNSDYMSKYEPIVYGWIKEHNFYGDRSNFDIWEIDRTKKNELHPTMKPIALCAKAIKNSSKEDEIVLDLFGGSGSTLIACEQTNRNCYMMELDPNYCDVIRKRYYKFIGKEEEWNLK